MNRIIQTSDTLIGAFLKGELKHMSCRACAVGTLCNNNPNWVYGFSGDITKVITPHLEEDYVNYHRAMRNNPYNPFETIKIENAFEGRNERASAGIDFANDPDGFKSLTAVFDLLCNDIDKSYFESEESKVNIFQIINGIMPQEEVV